MEKQSSLSANSTKMKPILLLVAIVLALTGCSTPIDTSSSHTRVLNPDQDDNVGGSFIESTDIRTMAQQISTQLLSLPEFSTNPGPVYVTTEQIQNSTRYLVDTDLLLNRLRLELNKYGKGQVRFLAGNNGQRARTRILREREKIDVQKAIEQAAYSIAQSDIIQNASGTVRLNVHPVANTNLFNMNADSFAALLRTKIKQAAGEKVIFARPGSEAETDYTLTGEFFAESIKREGVADTTQDLQWAQENQEQWYKNDSEHQSTVHGDQINVNSNVNGRRVQVGPNLTYKAIDPALWNNPNVTKTFNIMLVDKNDFAVLEKSINLEEQIQSGSARADFILTGDLSALSKASIGQRSDYVLVSFYMIDPVSNEMLWEYGYEVKRVTSRSVLYR